MAISEKNDWRLADEELKFPKGTATLNLDFAKRNKSVIDLEGDHVFQFDQLIFP